MDVSLTMLLEEHDGSEPSARVALGSASLLLLLDFVDFNSDFFLVAIGVLVIKESVRSNMSPSLLS